MHKRLFDLSCVIQLASGVLLFYRTVTTLLIGAEFRSYNLFVLIHLFLSILFILIPLFYFLRRKWIFIAFRSQFVLSIFTGYFSIYVFYGIFEIIHIPYMGVVLYFAALVYDYFRVRYVRYNILNSIKINRRIERLFFYSSISIGILVLLFHLVTLAERFNYFR